MPFSASRPCRHIGCPHVTQDPSGFCQNHRHEYFEYRKRKDAERPNSAKRGYGYAWKKARESWLRRNPLCVWCGKIATIVDHKIPIKDGGPLLDERNFQSMCFNCHEIKEGRKHASRQTKETISEKKV